MPKKKMIWLVGWCVLENKTNRLKNISLDYISGERKNILYKNDGWLERWMDGLNRLLETYSVLCCETFSGQRAEQLFNIQKIRFMCACVCVLYVCLLVWWRSRFVCAPSPLPFSFPLLHTYVCMYINIMPIKKKN